MLFSSFVSLPIVLNPLELIYKGITKMKATFVA